MSRPQSTLKQFQNLFKTKKRKKRSHKVGLPPASLVYGGEKKTGRGFYQFDHL